MQYFWVALGGGIGASLRHGLGQWSARALGDGFPVGTLAANILGSLLMGLLAGWLVGREAEAARLLLGVGLLGGFTTFSAFSLDSVRLLEAGRWGAAAGYVGGSVALSLLACLIGVWLARGLA